MLPDAIYSGPELFFRARRKVSDALRRRGPTAAWLFSAENGEAAVAGEVAGEAADLPQSRAVASVSGPGTLSTLLVSMGLVLPSCYPRNYCR